MICFDSNVTMWAVQAVPRAGEEALAELAKRYLAHLQRTKEDVRLPAVVVAEYLCWFNDTDVAEQERLIESLFPVLALDQRVAYAASRLLHDKPFLDAAKAQGPGARARVRNDALIVATAHVHRATALVSHDDGIKKLGRRIGLTVHEIPEVPGEPKNLFNQH